MATIATVKSFRMNVVRKSNTLTISDKNAKGEDRVLTINLLQVKGLADSESAFMERLTEGLPESISEPVDLTLPELNTLVDIRNKSLNVNGVSKQVEQVKREEESKMLNAANVAVEKITRKTAALKTETAALNETERRVIGLKNVVDIYNEDFYQVEYDLPTSLTTLSEENGGVTNPSDWFWLFAMRLTKSCWVFPASRLNNAEVQKWMDSVRGKIGPDQRKVKLVVIKYSRDQIDILRQNAVEELDSYMREMHGLLILNINKASINLNRTLEHIKERMGQGELDQISGVAEEREVLNDYHGKMRGYLRSAMSRLETGIRSAETFDLTEDVADLLKAYRESIRSQMDTFNADAQEKGIRQVELTKYLSQYDKAGK